jgi:hypothetical protein
MRKDWQRPVSDCRETLDSLLFWLFSYRMLFFVYKWTVPFRYRCLLSAGRKSSLLDAARQWGLDLSSTSRRSQAPFAPIHSLLSKKEIQNEAEFVFIDDLVPQDHLLRKVDKYNDFSFIGERVRPSYSENNGRASLLSVTWIA